ncbi:hypothetical protein HO173_010347 [Letharia columbiana]|uniref:Uncharacterized protein n=1 Tax=Letharia columbiana TaxID=112416 RepID=A0A8H6FMQ4_9LECA|nr:uncharacterized protein HO173_010347 [Letharia columbiana]KAF6231387.1 hypothetical protein HO173_010347 [Letharia columbiana]
MVKAQRQEAALPEKPMAMVVHPQAAQASSTLCPVHGNSISSHPRRVLRQNSSTRNSCTQNVQMAMGKSPACSSSISTTRTFFDFYGTGHRPRDTTPCKGSRAKHLTDQISTSASHLSTKSETPITCKKLAPSPLRNTTHSSAPTLSTKPLHSTNREQAKTTHPSTPSLPRPPHKKRKNISPRTRFYQARPSQPQPPARTPTSTYQPSQRKPPQQAPRKTIQPPLAQAASSPAEPDPPPPTAAPTSNPHIAARAKPNPTANLTETSPTKLRYAVPISTTHTHTRRRTRTSHHRAPIPDAKSEQRPGLGRHPDPNEFTL